MRPINSLTCPSQTQAAPAGRIPDSQAGLSRTAYQALRIIAGSEDSPGKTFARNQQAEERIFMGDSTFWLILEELLSGDAPLLIRPQGKSLHLPLAGKQQLFLSASGQDVLCGRKNALDTLTIDRWIGSVHLLPQQLWLRDGTKIQRA